MEEYPSNGTSFALDNQVNRAKRGGGLARWWDFNRLFRETVPCLDKERHDQQGNECDDDANDCIGDKVIAKVERRYIQGQDDGRQNVKGGPMVTVRHKPHNRCSSAVRTGNCPADVVEI